MKNTPKINPEETYSVKKLAEMGAFPGVKDYRSCLRRVMNDAALGKKSVLKAQIIGEGMSKRIYILGSNFLAYLATITKTA